MKKIKLVVCVILIMIFPLFSVGCKDNPNADAPNVNIDRNNNDNPSQEPEPEPKQEPEPGPVVPPVQYVIDENEANLILDKFETVIDGVLTKINNSNMLANESYTNNIGTETANMLTNLTYLSQMKKSFGTNNIVLDKLYKYNLDSVHRFFELEKINDNQININFTYTVGSEKTFYLYEIYVDNGEITKIMFNNLYSENKDLNYFVFSNLMVDISNSVFELYRGKVINSSTHKTYIENNFNMQKINAVSMWSYSLYEKIDYKQKILSCDYKPGECVDKIKTDIEKLKIGEGFNIYNLYYENTNFLEIVKTNFDYATNNSIQYKFQDNKFLKQS